MAAAAQAEQQPPGAAARNAAYLAQQQQHLQAVTVALGRLRALEAGEQLPLGVLVPLCDLLVTVVVAPPHWQALHGILPGVPGIGHVLVPIACRLPLSRAWWQGVFQEQFPAAALVWQQTLQQHVAATAVDLGLPEDWAGAAVDGMVLLSGSLLHAGRCTVSSLYGLLREVLRLQDQGLRLSNLGEALASHWDPTMRLVQPRVTEAFAQVGLQGVCVTYQQGSGICACGEMCVEGAYAGGGCKAAYVHMCDVCQLGVHWDLLSAPCLSTSCW